MTIQATLVGFVASTTNVAAYTTAAETLHANKPFLIVVCNTKATAPADLVSSFTHTHTGVTLRAVASPLANRIWGAASSICRLQVYCGLATADSVGTFTANFPVAQTGCIMELWEFTGADMTNPDGSAAFVHVTTDGVAGDTAGVSGTITMPAFTNANGVSGLFAHFFHAITETQTNEAGATTIGTNRQIATPALGGRAEFWNVNESTPSMTWVTSAQWAGVGVEIQNGPIGKSIVADPRRIRSNVLLRR
jgi:hypothetical protein